jgi:hypothetical protein
MEAWKQDEKILLRLKRRISIRIETIYLYVRGNLKTLKSETGKILRMEFKNKGHKAH